MMYGREPDAVWSETLAIGRPSWSTPTTNGVYVVRNGSWVTGAGTVELPSANNVVLWGPPIARGTSGAWEMMRVQAPSNRVGIYAGRIPVPWQLRFNVVMPAVPMRLAEHRPPCRVRPTRKAFRGLRARPGARGVLRRHPMRPMTRCSVCGAKPSCLE